MGRSFKQVGGSWIRIESTPGDRYATIKRMGIEARNTKIGFAVDAAGKHWKKGREYDVLDVAVDGRLVVGFKATEYQVGKISPHHHGLVVKNV